MYLFCQSSPHSDNSKILLGLLPKHRKKVLEQLSTKIPLKLTATLIDDENYWKRSCQARWEVCNINDFGHSWKRMYFERNLQYIVEHFVPETTDTTELEETMELSAKYIERVDIRQLLPPVKSTFFHDGEINATSSIFYHHICFSNQRRTR